MRQQHRLPHTRELLERVELFEAQLQNRYEYENQDPANGDFARETPRRHRDIEYLFDQNGEPLILCPSLAPVP